MIANVLLGKDLSYIFFAEDTFSVAFRSSKHSDGAHSVLLFARYALCNCFFVKVGENCAAPQSALYNCMCSILVSLLPSPSYFYVWK